MLACLVFGACAGAPPPLTAPPMELPVRYRIAPGRPADVPRLVAVAVFAVRCAPAGQSLENATLAIAAQDGMPFRAIADLPPGCRWLLPAEAAAWLAGERATALPLGSADAVVAPNLTTSIQPSSATLPELRFELDDGRCRLRLAPRAAGDRPRERILLREPLPGTGSQALFVPAPDRSFAGHVLLVTTGGAPRDGQVAAATAAAEEAAAPAPGRDERESRIAHDAIGELARRPALLAIARRLHLDRCVDALLSADEARLAAATTLLEGTRPASPTYAWCFERAVWSSMLPALQRDELPPAMRGCLLRHFGCLGADAASLQLRLGQAADAAAFDAALRDENVYGLESRSAVVRVRAHEWLAARGLAVPGFDPMADTAARRQVLRRHAAAEEAKSR